ncbi:MAG: hypothetical protein QOH12_2275 [Solirubrobacteraceae bacterium]|jgi:hypothetical protein|nr:hypothetical protein [Solirubrobacteraceae bacterium]
MQGLADIDRDITEVRTRLLEHKLYTEIDSAASLKTFMSHHVFAVWDFFSLAKRLQQVVTCVEVPWLPPADPTSARLINDIVLSEESDEDGAGGYASHFDLYLEAMAELGADTTAIRTYVGCIARGENPIAALDRLTLPPGVDQFVRFDMELALDAEPHQVAAAFCYGREDLIPDMFGELIRPLSDNGLDLDGTRIKYYIERHIILDSHVHAPLARRLVAQLCGTDELKWSQASAAATQALEARIALWDGIVSGIHDALTVFPSLLSV